MNFFSLLVSIYVYIYSKNLVNIVFKIIYRNMMVIKFKKIFWNFVKYFVVFYLNLKVFFLLFFYKSKVKRILFKKKLRGFYLLLLSCYKCFELMGFLFLVLKKKKKDFINVYIYMDK